MGEQRGIGGVTMGLPSRGVGSSSNTSATKDFSF